MRDETLYVCNRCGEAFALEEGYSQHYEEGDITLCPNCRSDDLDEAVRCEVCREIHKDWDLRLGVCPDCFSDAISAWKACIGDLQPWVRGVLEYEYGNLDITEKQGGQNGIQETR